MEIIIFRTAAANSPLQEYLESLDKKTRKKVAWAMDRLEKEGFNLLKTGIFSKVDDDLYELKIPYNGMQHRVMCGWINSIMYAVDGFAKKDQKLKKTDINRSQERIKLIKENNKNNNEK
jgi:phage-related protein